MNKYTINQLTQILGISRTAVNRKIEKYKFDTVQDYVNGVLNKLVILTDEQIDALKKEVENNKSVNTVSQHSYETKLNNNTPETLENQSNTNGMFETMLTQLRHYADTAINAERERTLLLEDKARENSDTAEFYKNETMRLTQEYNKDKTELTQKFEKAKKPLIIACATLLTLCIILLTCALYFYFNPKTVTQEKQVVKVITVDSNGKPISVLTEKQ